MFKRLPIAQLKLDRSFVADLDSNAGSHSLVRAIIRMAADLGMRVVGEGVENEAHCRALCALGCDEGQGHLFAPALPLILYGVVAQQMGLGFVTAIDPTQGQQGMLVGNFLSVLGITLIFATDMHFLVIAALNGHTVGGGLEVAMAADIRIARLGGGKIGLPEVGLGVLPGPGGTQRLARLLGKAKAIELMAEGATFDFEEALEYGIVNHVWDSAGPAEFMTSIMDYAKTFTAPGRAAKAVGLIKRSVQTGWELPLAEALAVERELQQQLFQSQDAREGIGSYLEKRKPEFSGK